MTLNEAILKVITTQFKKDAPEAFKFVANSGYKVYKGGGHFYVEHPITGKYVYAEHTGFGWDYNAGRYIYGYYIYRGYLYRNVKWIDGTECKFNFVAYLMKPYNADRDYKPPYRPTLEKYNRIKSAQWDVDYHEKKVNELKAELEREVKRITKDIEYHTVQAERSKGRLKDVRNELGLTGKKVA